MKKKMTVLMIFMALMLLFCGSTTSAATKLSKPARPKITNVRPTLSGIKLEWGKVSGATKYEVYRQRKNGKYMKVASTTRCYYHDKKTTDGAEYTYKIRAVKVKKNQTVKSKFSRKCSERYIKPIDGIVMSGNGREYHLLWKNIKSANAYQVLIATDKKFTNVIHKEEVSSARDGINLENEEKGTWYLKIRAVRHTADSAYYGPWSHILTLPFFDGGNVILYKPVIYLYPTEETEAEVTLDLAGEFTCVYPSFDEGSTWKVTAMPDGTLKKDDREYRFLYWEGEADLQPQMEAGDCIPGNETAAYLEKKLSALGLNDKEIDDFITYWLPQMESNPYNVIAFQTENYTELARLHVSPQPDQVIRVFMCWYASNEMVDLAAPEPGETPAREGFTVVEWGGSEIA